MIKLLRSGLYGLLLYASMIATCPMHAAGSISDNIVNFSSVLGYKLQYRVYLPENHALYKDLPVIFLTDGQWFIKNGDMVSLLDRMITRGSIKPLVAVFVDNRDPENLQDNRRNQQFFCNEKYAEFYRAELVPHIRERYKISALSENIAIAGMSFGALNAACFGLMATDTFGLIGMMSPAMKPVPGLANAYEKAGQLPLRFFLSHGKQQDNERAARKFRNILSSKDYELKYKTVNQGHSWRNWKPLLDDMLLYFFRAD